jgi:hypothetical protein
MRPAQEWTEDDIQAFVTEQRQEDLSLDYKAADALKKKEKKKTEVSKDVSAMANRQVERLFTESMSRRAQRGQSF